MINGKRVSAVMPAYNAAKTLEQTVRELPEMADIKILVDDKSTDQTVKIARHSWWSILFQQLRRFRDSLLSLLRLFPRKCRWRTEGMRQTSE